MELHDRAMPHDFSGTDLPEPPRCGQEELPPPDVFDEVIAAYKKDVDRTLLIESLKLSPEQRSQRFLRFMEMAYEIRRGGERSRTAQGPEA